MNGKWMITCRTEEGARHSEELLQGSSSLGPSDPLGSESASPASFSVLALPYSAYDAHSLAQHAP